MLRAWLIGLALLGAATIAFGVHLVMKARAAASWPSVTGVVARATVEVRSGSTTRFDSPADRERKSSFTPVVHYRWSVDGRSYTGSRYRIGGGSSLGRFPTRAEAQAALDRYAPGQPVTVFHDPADPAEAVLQPGGDWGAWVPLPIGVVLLAAGLAGLRRRPATGGRPAAERHAAAGPTA